MHHLVKMYFSRMCILHVSVWCSVLCSVLTLLSAEGILYVWGLVLGELLKISHQPPSAQQQVIAAILSQVCAACTGCWRVLTGNDEADSLKQPALFHSPVTNKPTHEQLFWFCIFKSPASFSLEIVH